MRHKCHVLCMSTADEVGSPEQDTSIPSKIGFVRICIVSKRKLEIKILYLLSLFILILVYIDFS